MTNAINNEMLKGMYRLTRDKQDYNNPVSLLLERAVRYNAILRILMDADRPLRCKEIAAQMPDDIKPWPEYPWTYHDVMHLASFMARDGIAERIIIGTETYMTRNGPKTVNIYGYKLAAGG